MKLNLHSLAISLLLAAGLFSSATLQAGAPGSMLPGSRDDGKGAVSAPGPEPAPAPAEQAPNWLAVASMIAAGTELALLVSWGTVAAAFSFPVIVGTVAVLIGTGCFSFILGLTRLRRMRNSGSTDPRAEKKARNAMIWGAVAAAPLLIMTLASWALSALLNLLIDL